MNFHKHIPGSRHHDRKLLPGGWRGAGEERWEVLSAGLHQADRVPSSDGSGLETSSAGHLAPRGDIPSVLSQLSMSPRAAHSVPGALASWCLVQAGTVFFSTWAPFCGVSMF